MRISCEVWTHGHHLETIELDRERLVVGARDTCDVVIEVDGVALEHALIEVKRADVVVAPRGAERVVHNGRAIAPLQSAPVWAGDVIELGGAQIIVDLEAPPASAGMRAPLPVRPRVSTAAGTLGRTAPGHALLLVSSDLLDVSRRQACADAMFAYLVSEGDARIAPWVLAEIVARGEVPPDDLARALCHGVARHRMLAALLPRVADHAGWATLAGSAYCHVPEDLRAGLEHAMLGHPSWQVRLFAALHLRDLGERERALRAVRRSFVASDFSPPTFTHAARPSRRIAVDVGPGLPLLSEHRDVTRAPSRVPLVLDAAEQALVKVACDAELATAMALVREIV